MKDKGNEQKTTTTRGMLLVSKEESPEMLLDNFKCMRKAPATEN